MLHAAKYPYLVGLHALLRMFKVRILTPEDYSFAVQLANTMNWNMAPEDFQYMASLEPDGSFLLEDDGKPVGVATCIGYGKVGWFGNLIIKEVDAVGKNMNSIVSEVAATTDITDKLKNELTQVIEVRREKLAKFMQSSQ